MPNTVFVESPTQSLYVIDGNPGMEGLMPQGRNDSQATLCRGQQAMYVINGAPVTDVQEHEAVLGFSPVSSSIGAPGGVLLMQTHFHEKAEQRETGRAALLLADVPALAKKHNKKTPAEPLGIKVVEAKLKDPVSSK